jgi:hypothetical protein
LTGIVGSAAIAGFIPAVKPRETSDKSSNGKAIDGFMQRAAASGTTVANYPDVDGRQTVLATSRRLSTAPRFGSTT